MRKRMRCDFKKGDTVLCDSTIYGQVMEIITEIDDVTEWDNSGYPLNVLVYLWTYDSEFWYNARDLEHT